MKQAFLWLLLIATQASAGNFVVEGGGESSAKIAEWAEFHRKDIGLSWFGHEMTDWPKPWTIKWSGAKEYDGETVYLTTTISVSGPNGDVMCKSVLAHEIMHALMHTETGKANPAWVSEGAAIMCETQEQQDKRMALYGELSGKLDLDSLEATRDAYHHGYKAVQALVKRKGKRPFMEFVRDGAKNGWAQALKRHYDLTPDQLRTEYG